MIVLPLSEKKPQIYIHIVFSQPRCAILIMISYQYMVPYDVRDADCFIAFRWLLQINAAIGKWTRRFSTNRVIVCVSPSFITA